MSATNTLSAYPVRRSMNVLVWHVHGSWLSSFVAGGHRYHLAVAPGDARGRKRPNWPDSVGEVEPGAIDPDAIDVVVAQRLEELDALQQWTRGQKKPVIFVEHNTPQGRINEMRHPLADRDDIIIAHVTHFNALFWDTGATRTQLIEHGVADGGYRYEGSLARAAVVINEAKRRARVTGTDLLPWFERAAPIDLFGIGTPHDVPQHELHAEIARRRLYLHPYRWTSLGLALLEAMMLGMPVVALNTTEASRAVVPETGICTNDLATANEAIRWLCDDREAAQRLGRAARAHVLANYSLGAFLSKWDALLEQAAR